MVPLQDAEAVVELGKKIGSDTLRDMSPPAGRSV